MNKNRIEYLQNKYSENNIAPNEILTKETRKQINHENYKAFRRDRVYSTLKQAKMNNQIIKETLYYIDKIGNVKKICSNCKDTQIISAIAIHLNRKYNKSRIDKNILWKEHDLNWKMYGLIISNLYNLL